MIYSASFLGATTIATPPRTIYGINKLTLKNNDSYFDNVRVLDYAMTSIQRNALLL